MAVDLIRVESNERVDLTDFEALSNDVMRDVQGHLGKQFFCDPGRTRSWILSGFAMSTPGGKQVQVDKGKAILAYRTSGVIQYGMVATEGDTSKIVDMNGWANTTYGIYVRFQYVASDAQSRIFWDPTGTGTEFAQTMDTRFQANWSMRVESSSPGDEWLKIGEVAWGAMTFSDHREFYFEGPHPDTPAVADYESGWSTEGGGVATDRNADRQQYGVTDLQMFTAAMRQCVEVIRGRGLRRWYEKGIGGINVGFDTDPLEDVLAVGDVDFSMTFNAGDPQVHFGANDYLEFDRGLNRLAVHINGTDRLYMLTDSLNPQADNTVDLGQGGAGWKNIRTHILTLETANDKGVGSHCNPTDDDTYNLGSPTREWQNLYLDGTAFIDQLNLSVTGGQGLGTHFLPVADNTYQLGDSAAGLGSGTDRRYNHLYLANGWQLEASGESGSQCNIYNNSAPADEKWWQWQFNNSGKLELRGYTDLYAAPQTYFGISRTGATAGTAFMTLSGKFWATQDSGYPATPYTEAIRVRGLNPLLLFEDTDTGINAAHRNWGIISRQGVGDVGFLEFELWDAARTTNYTWLSLETESGAVTEVDYILMRAVEGITFGTGLANGVVGINNDGTVSPGANPLGLTRRKHLGAGGAAYSIVGTADATPRTSTGFIVVWVAGTERYIPFFDNHDG